MLNFLIGCLVGAAMMFGLFILLTDPKKVYDKREEVESE